MRFSLILIFIASLFIQADHPAYLIYTPKGKSTKFKKLVKEAQAADVVLFGELHNQTIGHWLQLELLKALQQGDKAVVLGAEMFESDDQLKIDEYFSGTIPEKNFRTESKLWDNYGTDYAPIVNFAKANDIPFVGTNVPRRYASYAARNGLDALSELTADAQKFLPPLPVEMDEELPGYKAMSGMGAAHGMKYIAQAQALKDATMAHFILENWSEGEVFLHLNGAYHSKNKEGIYWYLKQANPELNILTISMATLEDLSEPDEEFLEQADFLIAIPENMMTSY